MYKENKIFYVFLNMQIQNILFFIGALTFNIQQKCVVHNNSSPRPQSPPLRPGMHTQRPVTGSFWAPSPHRTTCVQLTPYRPAGHAATETHTHTYCFSSSVIHSLSVSEMDSQVLQRGPINPAGHSQAPVEGTHLPPFSHRHSRSQLGPYRPSSQTEITATQFNRSITHFLFVAFKYELPVKSYLGHICGHGNLVRSNTTQTPGGRAASSLNTGRPGYSFSRMFLGYKLTEREVQYAGDAFCFSLHCLTDAPVSW